MGPCPQYAHSVEAWQTRICRASCLCGRVRGQRTQLAPPGLRLRSSSLADTTLGFGLWGGSWLCRSNGTAGCTTLIRDADYGVGDRVLVPTESGPEVAECVWAPEWGRGRGFAGLPVCAGMAAPEQLERDAANRRRRAEAKLAAKKLIKKHELPMKVVAVDFIDSESTSTS